MCTCITFCWTTQLLNTTLIGPWAFEGRELCVLVLHFAGPDTQHILIDPVAFGERELCVFVLHSAGPDSYLTLLRLARGIWRTGVICTCVTFCWTRQLSSQGRNYQGLIYSEASDMGTAQFPQGQGKSHGKSSRGGEALALFENAKVYCL